MGHDEAKLTPRPTAQALRLAAGGLLLLLGAAFATGWLTRDLPLFALHPPGGGSPDMRPDQRLHLHITFFTIWAALLLSVPALALFPLRQRSPKAASYWLALWTVAFIAFAVHFFWAVVIVFDNDWQRILHTPRVSAPVLDTVFALWWAADVALAWTLRSEAPWVRVQRVGVHALATLLFFMGAAREGEQLASRLLGWTLAAGVVAGAWAWWRRRSQR